MKKTKPSILILALILSFSLFGCTSEITHTDNSDLIKYTKIEDLEELNTYDIKVELNASDMTYRGKQYITYLNKSEDDLESIYFHIYPNAFETLEEAPILFDVASTIKQSDYIGGYIDIEKVEIEGVDLDFVVEDDKDTIVKINLPTSLKVREKIKIYLEYEVKIPSSKDRFGYHDNGINFGNWYPIASVYDEDGWHLDPYYKVGDPFFSEVSNYNVEIKVPKEMEVVASGKVVSEDIEGKNRIYNIKGEKIRDFAFVASEKFVVDTRQVDDTLISLYSITDNQTVMDTALDFTEDSIRIFNEKFGKYPYDEYKVVNTEFPSGMEYPGIVFVSNDYYNESLIDLLELVIVHETAHQWWYGIIGTDQINESWIDEGLATYSEAIYMDDVYGGDAGDFHYRQNIINNYKQNARHVKGYQRVDKPLSDFSGWHDYSILVYSRGVGFFKEISEEYGSDILEKILQEAYNRYKFKNMTSDEFIALCEEITGDSMDSLIEKHLR